LENESRRLQQQVCGGGHYVGADLGDNSGYYVFSNAINNLGQIAGGTTFDGVQDRAFVWTSGHYRDLGTLGGTWSWTWSLNIRGQVLGISERSDQSVGGFGWQQDTITDLDDVVPSDTPPLVNPGGIKTCVVTGWLQ